MKKNYFYFYLILIIFSFYNSFFCGLYKNIIKDNNYLKNSRTYILEKIIPLLPKDLIENKTIQDYTNTQTKKLSFVSAIALWYFAQEKDAYIQYEKSALEQMIKLCPNPFISEILLYSLIFVYYELSLYNNVVLACQNFFRLFPGSHYTQIVRALEVISSFELCRSYHYDETQLLETYFISKRYSHDFPEDKIFYSAVIEIFITISNELLKGNLNVTKHYMNRYHYTWNSNCLYSVVQRLYSIKDHCSDSIEFFSSIGKMKEECNFIERIEEITYLIDDFLKKHSFELPKGKNYIEEHEKINEYIKKNELSIKLEEKDILKKINQFLN